MRKVYFDFLNYTIGNEDSALELAVMPENAGHVFCVAGSGSRVIPLFAKNPARVTCVDLSSGQLCFTEIKIASFIALERDKFLSFWGFARENMDREERKMIFSELDLSDKTRLFGTGIFERKDWGPILYEGKWERTFKKLSAINRKIVGRRGVGIFDCRTEEDQLRYLEQKFPQKAWSLAVFLLGNAVFFNAALYKGSLPKRNISGTSYSFYKERLDRLFARGVARENFFLQLLFLGKIDFSDGLPAECDPTIYIKAQAAARSARIEYVCGDILELVKKIDQPIDFLSFSDVPSYFRGPREQDFMQKIRDALVPGGIVANRYYLRIPERMDTTGYERITDKFSEAIAREKVQMYCVDIFRKNRL